MKISSQTKNGETQVLLKTEGQPSAMSLGQPKHEKTQPQLALLPGTKPTAGGSALCRKAPRPSPGILVATTWPLLKPLKPQEHGDSPHSWAQDPPWAKDKVYEGFRPWAALL